MQYVLGALIQPYRAWPPEEKVRVTFDNKPGFKLKAHSLFDEVMNDPRGDIRERLHSGFGFEDSLNFAGLQAADLLAYEVKKMFEARARNEDTIRSAMKRLALETQPSVHLIDEDDLKMIMGLMENEWGHLVDKSGG